MPQQQQTLTNANGLTENPSERLGSLTEWAPHQLPAINMCPSQGCVSELLGPQRKTCNGNKRSDDQCIIPLRHHKPLNHGGAKVRQWAFSGGPNSCRENCLKGVGTEDFAVGCLEREIMVELSNSVLVSPKFSTLETRDLRRQEQNLGQTMFFQRMFTNEFSHITSKVKSTSTSCPAIGLTQRKKQQFESYKTDGKPHPAKRVRLE